MPRRPNCVLMEGRKEMFNLTTHSTHLREYGVRHMAKDLSDSESGNPLSPYELLFPNSSKGSFYMHHSTDRITHNTTFVTPVVEHWLKREIAQWVHHEGSIRRPIAPWAIDPATHRTMSERSYHGATSRSVCWWSLDSWMFLKVSHWQRPIKHAT